MRIIFTLVNRPRPLISKFTGNIPLLDRNPGINVSANSCIQSAANIMWSDMSYSYKPEFGSFSYGSRIIKPPKWPLTL